MAITRLAQFCATTIALIALTACGGTFEDTNRHLRSNGASDSMVDDHAGPPPTDLVGMSNAFVIERLGDPDIARFEGGVLYWRYSTQQCLLHIYLSHDPSTGELFVEHMSVRPRSYLVPSGACPAPSPDDDSPEL